MNTLQSSGWSFFFLLVFLHKRFSRVPLEGERERRLYIDSDDKRKKGRRTLLILL